MIRQATKNDLAAVMVLIDRVKGKMNAQGNFQWDEQYPLKEDFLSDYESQELYLYEKNDGIYGVCTIAEKGHEEYGTINWTDLEAGLTIKRLAIDPHFTGKGIADDFLDYAEELVRQKEKRFLLADTFADNTYANLLFKRRKFKFVEKREDPNADIMLHYYEKEIYQDPLY
ncbi:N-acetylglutamate synthase, GNAT family [Pelagirhabdus alkalitolerans]|uniref:N-acetylglutamate synthase, GNAT family n=1 Tax=Pelagirhabdus alkalitolerans TaxID=1612202 RepID=A0A1G6JG31_9BACI|nr:GNAT family N-acetyltransferase [Pelagirhabdus alkalitolerans]SDC17670.1 N-acetylglutamate synthase, GNAT family [Pelagirhabdus alkalitolerans]